MVGVVKYPHTEFSFDPKKKKKNPIPFTLNFNLCMLPFTTTPPPKKTKVPEFEEKLFGTFRATLGEPPTL